MQTLLLRDQLGDLTQVLLDQLLIPEQIIYANTAPP
jgi:hypothetical protein